VHVLTKFLVVLAAVLSVLLSGLAIAYTSNADRIVSQLKSAEAAAAAARAAKNEALTVAQRDLESVRGEKSDLEDDLQQLRQENSQLRGENDTLRADKLRCEQTAAAYEARIDQFVAIVEAQQRLSDARAEELQALRERVLDYTRREIELTDRINDLDGELEVSRETNRSLQEQVVMLRQDASGVAEDTTGVATLRAPRGFRGRVTGVQTEGDGGVLVQINAGLNDQLRQRMKLNVVRDGGFVGSVVLEVVDLNESVGRLELLRDGAGAVQSGDLVLPAGL
jgi:predicted  nucleic acid-binding Zn-ribbon protein